MQYCAGFISAESLHVSGVKRPSSGVLKNWHGGGTCTVLHQVDVLFDLYYDARKHKSKTQQATHPCPQRDSNPQSLPSSGRRLEP